MKRTSNSMVQTVSIELNQNEIADLTKARETLRALNDNLPATEQFAMEQAIYLISTILGSHQ